MILFAISLVLAIVGVLSLYNTYTMIKDFKENKDKDDFWL